MVSLLSLIVVLGILVFVHELGHYIAAKSVGIGVPRFSIGFGPRTPLSFRRGETEFVVSWVPLGGYVKMASREELEAYEALEGGETPYDFPPEKLFENKPLWARLMVILAGVTMNVVFAWVTYFALAMSYGDREVVNTTVARFDPERLPAGAEVLADVPFGSRIVGLNGEPIQSANDLQTALATTLDAEIVFEFENIPAITLDASDYAGEERLAILTAYEPLIEPRIGQIEPGTPASRAGLEPMDLILEVDGEPVREWGDLVGRIEQSAEQPLVLQVQRADTVFTAVVTPDSRTVTDPDTGESVTQGRLGVYNHVEVRHTRYGPVGALGRATSNAVGDVQLIAGSVIGLFVGRVSPKELGGPILIGQVAGQVAQAGLEAFLRFLAFFSVNLAVLNMLPIPVLDGGQFVVLLAEGVRGKPLDLNLRMRLTQVGLFLLMGLMVYVVTADVLRTLGLL